MSRLSRVSHDARKVALRNRSQWGSPAYRALFRMLPCVVDRVVGCDPSHLKTRGAGGRYYSILPMTRRVHRRWEENDPELIARAEEENWYGWASWIAEKAIQAGVISQPLPPENAPPPVEPPPWLVIPVLRELAMLDDLETTYLPPLTRS